MDAVADAAADDAGTEVETMLFPTALSPLLFLPRPQTPGLPTSRGNDAVTSGNTKKLRCTHQGCPSPRTHDTSACKYHAQLVLVRKREREQAACAAGDALPSPAINLAMAPLPLIILVCLILILPTLHVVRYSSIHGHVSTTALFLILGLFRARNCHLLCHDRLRQEEKRRTR